MYQYISRYVTWQESLEAEKKLLGLFVKARGAGNEVTGFERAIGWSFDLSPTMPNPCTSYVLAAVWMYTYACNLRAHSLMYTRSQTFYAHSRTDIRSSTCVCIYTRTHISPQYMLTNYYHYFEKACKSINTVCVV